VGIARVVYISEHCLQNYVNKTYYNVGRGSYIGNRNVKGVQRLWDLCQGGKVSMMHHIVINLMN